MDLFLEHQVALITGSSRGIGKCIAETFLAEGADVIFNGRDLEVLSSVTQEMRLKYPKRSILYFKGDLSNEQEVKALAVFIEKECSMLNHVVCNIGCGKATDSALKRGDFEWQKFLSQNLFSATSVVEHLQPLLIKAAESQQLSSTITFIGSICGMASLGCPVAYAASKSALISYAKNITRPLGAKGVRVNTVSPGNIIFTGSTWEDKVQKNADAVRKMLDSEVALKRLGEPKEVAAVVAFLSSKQASFITGANIVVDGGQIRSLL